VTHPILSRLRNRLIVSCQALVGSPLRDSRMIAALAACAERGGAGGVRVDGPDDVAAVRRAVAIPIIGIYKQRGTSPVYITPTYEAGRAVAQSGAEIVAVQATKERASTPDRLPELIARLHSECRVLVMADVSTLEEGLDAAAAGADLVATTMSGYTPHSPKMQGPDLDLVRRLARQVSIPVVAEGRIRTPQEAALAIQAGGWAVVVGRAITMPEAITEGFVRAIAETHNAERLA
jgi:N-acylglucosamine-6-phosphate 2-epimerase